MATVLTHFTVDSGVWEAFKGAIPRGERSRHIQAAMAAAAGARQKTTDGIPKEKLLEQTVADLNVRIEAKNKELKAFKQKYNDLVAKYNRFVRRRR